MLNLNWFKLYYIVDMRRTRMVHDWMSGRHYGCDRWPGVGSADLIFHSSRNTCRTDDDRLLCFKSDQPRHGICVEDYNLH